MRKEPKPGLSRSLRVFAILVCTLLLLAAGGGAYLWLLHAQASLETYRSPIRVQPSQAGHQTAPIATQVVVVLIDGLRTDAMAAMPTLALLQRQGASAQAIARPPTYSQPTWATIVTGAWPEINGAPLLNVPESQLGPLPVDHIFATARRAGLSTALAGSSWWAKMIPRDMLDAQFFVDGFDATADQQVADTALRFLRNFHPNFTLVYFGNVDTVGEQAGATSRAYREAALRVDDHLRDILQVLDLHHAVLMVVADHGQIDRGGHGGGEHQVVRTPFVAVGDAIVPGSYGTIAQTDIAPTIAAILGAPMPRLSQGAIRFDMLRCDEVKQAETQVEEALQHQEYGNLYLHSIGQGSLSETAQGDVAVAVSSLEVSNFESAFRLGHMATERIDAEVTRGRQRRIQRDRSLRFPVAATFVGVPLLTVLLRGGRRGRWLLVCAAITLLAYHGLYLQQGQVYSFSGLTGLVPFVEQTAQRMLVASAVGMLLIVWRLMHDGEGSALGVIQTSLGYSLLVVYLLGCQAAVAFWLNGLRFTWYVPNMGAAFWLLAALVQVLLAAAAGLLMPIVLLLAGLAYQGVAALGQRLRIPAGGD